MRTDSELYNSFLSGENAAYDELMIRHGDALTAFLNGYVHNPEDAEDLMIEAFARIMIKKPQIGEDKFKAYLYKTGRNLVTRFHFRRTRLEVFSIEELEAEPADGSGPAELFSDKNRKETLHRCMDRLDPQVREALWLVYFENMSYAEAAEVMRINTKRVDHLLQRGKQNLRTELEKEGITELWDIL
ncbi:MAG: sigma-70 family RNA polymerase sigma factor [Lachnospiraceae bacterium]|nr:sigma-70 family RNA polymerase sigma factor [Lachnospiraceae bacterium]